MVLEHHTLISILSLVFAWLLNIGVMAYICNNHGLFSTFTLFIEKIVGAVIISYGRDSISMGWKTPMGINCMVNMINILYTLDLFTNLFSASKLRANGLYIIIKDYTI